MQHICVAIVVKFFAFILICLDFMVFHFSLALKKTQQRFQENVLLLKDYKNSAVTPSENFLVIQPAKLMKTKAYSNGPYLPTKYKINFYLN